MKLLILSALLCWNFCTGTLTLLDNPYFNGSFATASWGPHETLTGLIADPATPLAFGSLVFVPPAPGFETCLHFMQYVQQLLLPRAILLIQINPGIPGYDQNICIPFENISIPIISVDSSALAVFFALNGTANQIPVQVTYSPNLWKDVSNSGVWFAGQYLIVAAQLAGLILCIIRMVQFSKTAGFSLSVAIVSLFICMVSCCLSIVWWAADGAFSGRAFFQDTHFVLSTPPLTLTLVLMLVSTFYWHELITLAQIQVRTFISGFRVPFLVVSTGILAFEYLIEILKVAATAQPWIYRLVIAFTAILLAFYVGAIVYFLYVSISVAKFFSKKGRDLSRVKLTTVRMAVNIIGAALVLVSLCLALNNDSSNPYGVKYTFFIAYSGVSIVNISTPAGLQLPRKFSSTSTKMSSAGSRN